VQLGYCSRGLGHLHQGENPFLHARAAGGGYDHQGNLLVQRAAGEPGDLLTDHRAHRATHEGEIHDGKIEVEPIDPRGAGIHRISIAALLFGHLQAIGIMLEFQRVHGPESAVELTPGARVGQYLDVLFGADPPMPAAFGTDIECLLELFANIDMTTLVALLPGVGGDLEPLTLGSTRLSFFLKPCHHGHRDLGSVEG
jgi:hypothetical protein